MDEGQVNGSDEIIDSILDSPHVQKILEARWAEEYINDDKNRMIMQQFQKSKNAQKWIHFACDDLAGLL